MREFPTRSWRYATARWAGTSPDSPATAGKRGARPIPRRTRWQARGAATVIDLSISRIYRRGHIPGAWFAIRARLEQALKAVPARESFVLTSEDGRLADLAAPELAALSKLPVRYLKGGNAAWQAAGHPLTADGANMADEPIDVWLRPYERAGGVSEAMVEYLTWETDLPERIARDGTADFAQFRG